MLPTLDTAPARVNSSDALFDRFGRVHTECRISVTDRCNIRCQYCMPAENVIFLQQDRLLTYDQIVRFVQIIGQLGVRKIRLTGGEPLLRPQLYKLIEKLSGVDCLDEIALTTNGMLLADQAPDLKQAGLNRINVSLDTLCEATFERISRRKGLEKVLQGIFRAQELGFDEIRLNALVMPQINEADIIPLAHFARQHQLPLRFIEFMPLDADRQWNHQSVITGEMIRQRITQVFGELTPIQRADSSQPSTDFAFADGKGIIGFIDPVSKPFCGQCNRLRLTADGKIRNCLFGQEEWDVSSLLSAAIKESEESHGESAEAKIIEILKASVLAKHASHGIASSDFLPPQRAMYQIGG